MKKALLIGIGLMFGVIIVLPLVVGKGTEYPQEVTGAGNRFRTPEYAQRLGLQEVSREVFRSCPTGLAYEAVVQRLGVPGVQLQKEDLPPIPFEHLRTLWKKVMEHPEKEVYAWVSTKGEVMTIAFRNGESIHVYYGQDAGSSQ